LPRFRDVFLFSKAEDHETPPCDTARRLKITTCLYCILRYSSRVFQAGNRNE
jgi:hypothetical protein